MKVIVAITLQTPLFVLPEFEETVDYVHEHIYD